MDTPTFNELSICAGYGGLGMGVGIAVPGTRGVCYVEREAASIEILAARMQDGSMAEAPIWTDLCTFDGKPWRGVVDIITAGIPCQPWSLAGKQAGFADERHLGEELVRVVGEVGPSYVFVENVSGFVRLGAPDLLGRLSEIGYDAEWGLFSAAGVGATHRRQRFFLLAYRRGMADSSSVLRRDIEQREPSGRQANGVRDQGQATASHDGEAVGNSPGIGCREGEPEPILRSGGATSSVTGSELADADGIGPSEPRCSRGRRPRLEDYGFPAPFPPGPGGDWSGIPEEWQPAVDDTESGAKWQQLKNIGTPPGEVHGPGFTSDNCHGQETPEPPLRGMANGSPGRVDQLRMLGNGVVPLQAAHAFTALYRRISS